MDKEEAVEKIRKAISAATAPAEMSKEDARDVLEEIAADIEGHLDALRSEIAAEEFADTEDAD